MGGLTQILYLYHIQNHVPPDGTKMSSLTTAIDILRCFSTDTPELRVSDIARRVSVPKSTVSRLLKEMQPDGLVEQDPRSRRYRPGPLAFRLGTLYQAHLNILDLVENAVEELVEEFRLIGYVGVLDGTDVVILRIRQGSDLLRIVLEPGSRLPAYATAIGMALLARLDDEALIDLLPPVMTYEATEWSIERADLLRDLGEFRKSGCAETTHRTFVGIGAVGAAVGTADGRQSLGLCLSYPTNAHFETKRADMVQRVAECARRIGLACGDPFWADLDPGTDVAGPAPNQSKGAERVL